MAIVLPSLDPDKKFLTVLDGLEKAGFEHIIVVNDGSSADRRHFFDAAAALPGCTVLTHEVNRGKGRALKTAFAYAAEHLPGLRGVITIDGDGQHLTEDILACGQKMLEHEDSVVLGCRDFSLPGIPPRSVAGNRSTSRLFRLFFGIRLSDTQTGLRAIPAALLPSFCEIGGERFEYETNMLLQMKRMRIPFLEQPITTVYDPEDYSSHYNALKDSLRILKVMLRFMLTGPGFRFAVSAVLSWIADNGLYLLGLSLIGTRLAPAAASAAVHAAARVCSSLLNFNLNNFYVFRSRENYWKAFGKYYCLCLPQTLISIALVSALIGAFSLRAPVAAACVKILIEVVLFFISYFIQKKWVFCKK